MRMKHEVQQANVLLLGHVSCKGCKSPQDIHKHFSHLGKEYFTHHVQGLLYDFSDFFNMPFEQPETEHDQCFSPATDSSVMNLTLPEFDRELDFHVKTPLHTD